jgi:protein-tyrosine phosphatase
VITRLKQWLGGERVPAERAGHTRVLMICTGNICRSPTAEGVLRVKLQRAGLAGVHVDSAGTQGYHTAEPPDPRAVRAAAARGYDLSRLKARPMRPDDWDGFDWLVAMDRGHMEWLRKRAPSPAALSRVGLLMPFSSRFPGVDEVPDPYYGGPEGFEHVLDLVEDACDGLVSRLRNGQGLVTPGT